MKTGLSDCCGAPVKAEGHTTSYYVCRECGGACDLAGEEGKDET